jgi:hypothetical protein
MNALAAWLGTLLGAVLKQALPTIIECWLTMRRATVEDSASDPALVARLRERLSRGDANDPGASGTAGPTADPDAGGNLGPGSGRRPGRE